MKQPQNFDTIDHKHFTTKDGSTFGIEISNNTMDGTVFVFYDDNDERMADNCLLFDINWEKNLFSIKECPRGRGSMGNWIEANKHFGKEWAMTSNNFIDFLNKQTEKFIDNFFN